MRETENEERVRFKVCLPGPLLIIFLALFTILPIVDLITDDMSPETPRWFSALILLALVVMAFAIPSVVAYIRAQNEWIADTFNNDGTLKTTDCSRGDGANQEGDER